MPTGTDNHLTTISSKSPKSFSIKDGAQSTALCPFAFESQTTLISVAFGTGNLGIISLTGPFSRNQANHNRKTFSLDFSSSSRVSAGMFCIRPSGRSVFGSCQIFMPSLKSSCHSSGRSQYIILDPRAQEKYLVCTKRFLQSITAK